MKRPPEKMEQQKTRQRKTKKTFNKTMKRQHHKSMDFWRGVRRHFARALPFLWDRWKHWNSINTQFYWFLRTQNKMKKLNNLKLVKTADSIPQVFVRVLKLFNVLSSSMKTTKHCKTQWTMTFSNMSPAELQLRSGEPQAFFSSIYIYIIYTGNLCIYIICGYPSPTKSSTSLGRLVRRLLIPLGTLAITNWDTGTGFKW